MHAGSYLAAGVLQQLSENSHLGFNSFDSELHQVIELANSLNASGLATSLYDDGRGSRDTGKERDSESGLDYFEARYYGSALGRFTSADWSEKPEPVPYADFSNPQTLNQYAYVLNNPLAHPDKDGHCCDDELTWAGNVAKSFANSFISLANTVINTPDPDVPIPNGPEINIPIFTVNSGSANVVGTVLGMALPLGGEGSGLSKGAQMLENAAQGAAGIAKVAGELVSEGTTILGGISGTLHTSPNNPAYPAKTVGRGFGPDSASPKFFPIAPLSLARNRLIPAVDL